MEDLITTHGLDIEGRVRVLEELRPYVQALTDPVEQDLWLRATSERLGVDAAALRRSLTSQAPISAARLDPRTNLAVSLEKAVIRWVLAHPDAVTLEELEEWAVEFENRELKGLMDLIITSYREHGSLDHGLLVQQAPGETQRQHICALTLEEDESGGPAGDFLAADWRRRSLHPAAEKGPGPAQGKTENRRQRKGRRSLSLVGQAAGDSPTDRASQKQVHTKRREWMNKGMGMDGFQDIMPMGDDDNLITVDDLNDSLSPESLLNEQMKDIMIFDDLEIPPPEASSMAMPIAVEHARRGRGFGPGGG